MTMCKARRPEVVQVGLYEDALRDGIVPPPTSEQQQLEDAMVDLLDGREHVLADGTTITIGAATHPDATS